MFRTIILTVLLCFPLTVFSAVRTWDGGGADANWQTAANWVGDVAPSANDDLVFPASAAQFTTNNNFFILTNFNSITIEGGAYSLGGNPIRLSNGLSVVTGGQTINLAISLNGAQTFNTGSGAAVTIVALSVGSFNLAINGDGVVGIGLISGSGGIVKNGVGAAALLAASGFNGPITLNNGLFIVDANIPGSNVTINGTIPTGQALDLSGFGGTGTIGSASVNQGVISAGTLTSPTGILNISSGLTFTANAAYICKLAGTTPGANGHDQLNVTGSVSLNNAVLAPVPWDGFRPQVGDTFVILRNDGSDPVNGTFLNAPEGSVFSGPLNTAFRISYIGGDGNDIVLTSVPRARFDFDGDGRSDVSTFTPSTGNWNLLLSQSGSAISRHWGATGDRLAPADYDGDNKTDLAVFRPSEGVWYIFNSRSSTVTFSQFGVAGDIPVPNDYDGDGRADITVFRPSSGDWWQLRSLGNQVVAQHFGQNGDLPNAIDIDGDGMGDLCVFRPGDGTWHFLHSSNQAYGAFPFGLAGDIPTPADFDGDGKTDVAVFRPASDSSQPDFYILLSGSFNYYGISWGLPGDIPVVADYDGDGRADIAIYRPSDRVWYLLRSTEGFTSVQFAQSSEDRPIPQVFP